MTQEDLLKPRYEVIADYPDSEFTVGQILEVDIYNPDEDDCKIFPHLFHKLEWWEKRDIKDMPEYVKDEDGEVWKVYEYSTHKSSYVLLNKNFKDFYFPYGDHILYELLPSTLEEYTNYINTQTPHP